MTAFTLIKIEVPSNTLFQSLEFILKGNEIFSPGAF